MAGSKTQPGIPNVPERLCALPLALSMGDPAGIGPEVIAKAWRARVARAIPPFYVIGVQDALHAVDIDLPCQVIARPGDALAVFDTALPIMEIPIETCPSPGRPTSDGAKMAREAIALGTRQALRGKAAALVTAPIHKAGLYGTGFDFKGHTDYLAHLCDQDESDAVMLLVGGGIRVAPLTIHIALKDVPKAVTKDAILRTAKIMLRDLETRFGFSNPRLAITGLNPHAGEDGSMGLEEQEHIIPAILELQNAGHRVSGPHPADTLFSDAARMGYDAALAMYHDQALIPVKTLDFSAGVNTTLGLKIVRTSPDHGTAFDIAGQDMADPESLIQALFLAARLAD